MDMLVPEPILVEEEPPPEELPEGLGDVAKFYEGATVLVTGATGYLGKLLLEKMLRSCGEVRRVYILARVKNHYNVERRLENILEMSVFEVLRRVRPQVQGKVHIVRGDLSQPDMGVESGDKDVLVNEVDIIFHLGSTPTTDDNLRLSTHVNVRALRDLVRLAKQMKNLKAFVHVSSVYANCPRNVLEEDFGRSYVSAKVLVDFVESMDPNVRHSKPIALGKWPNNHLFTKSVAEDVIRTEGSSLPIAIVRPSIVLATKREPTPGWADNVNGLTGLVMTSYLGLTRSVLAKKDNIADLVPADHVVNAMLASAWDVANTKTLNFNEEVARVDEDVLIYNLPGIRSNPITWGRFFELTEKYGRMMPSIHAVWHPWRLVHQNKTLHFYMVLLLHYIPAYLYDCVMLYFTSSSKYLGYYSKIDGMSHSLSFLTLNGWEIRGGNTRRLWSKMSQVDRRCFDFDVGSIDWDQYLHSYVRGIRVHVLKDRMVTLPEALKDYKRRMLVSLATITAFVICVLIVVF